jgi:hypothetical protein
VSRRPLTASDYQAKLAKIEALEDRLLARIERTLTKLRKTRRKANYTRKKITELSD